MVPGAACTCTLPLQPPPKAAGAGVSLWIACGIAPLVLPGCCTASRGLEVAAKEAACGFQSDACVSV